MFQNVQQSLVVEPWSRIIERICFGKAPFEPHTPPAGSQPQRPATHMSHNHARPRGTHTHTVINKETSVKHTLAEEIVDRDLEFFVPSPRHRERLGGLYVPMLRIGLIQLELVLKVIRDQYYAKLTVRVTQAPVTRARACAPLTST
jgi:hypothetical protein